MRACVALSFALATVTCCLNVHQSTHYKIHSDIQVPLKPIVVTCLLSDIVVVSSPVVPNGEYFLTKPNGHMTRLNISKPTYKRDLESAINTENNAIVIKSENNLVALSLVNYRTFDLLPDEFGNAFSFDEMTKHLKDNDVVIGPLLQEDHGNWMISAYFKNEEGKAVEMYQVITLIIEDYVPPKVEKIKLSPGETFELSFAYSIPGLESCEVHPPETTFDRFYERNLNIDLALCGYVIKNVTSEDHGIWRITGVGDIVYWTLVYLDVEHSKPDISPT